MTQKQHNENGNSTFGSDDVLMRRLSDNVLLRRLEKTNPIVRKNEVYYGKDDSDNSGNPTNHRIDFDLSRSSSSKSKDKLSLRYDYLKVDTGEEIPNGNVTVFRNGQKISFFDITDDQLLQIALHLPELDCCVEGKEIAERLLCLDFRNPNSKKIAEALYEKNYMSAGVALLNACMQEKNLLPVNYTPGDDEAKETYIEKLSSNLIFELSISENTSSKNTLLKLAKTIERQTGDIKSRYDLLKSYCILQPQEYIKGKLKPFYKANKTAPVQFAKSCYFYLIAIAALALKRGFCFESILSSCVNVALCGCAAYYLLSEPVGKKLGQIRNYRLLRKMKERMTNTRS